MESKDINQNELLTILRQVYSWSSQHNFVGYNKHDGLNSPIMNTLFGWGKWPRIFAIQTIMRFPFNIRPMIGVKKSYNPKGLSLFCNGCLDLYQATRNQQYLQDALSLLSILETINSPGNWSGICWGYHYPWQDPNFFAPNNTPNAIVTSFVCDAFLSAYEITGENRYLEIVKSSINFLLNDLKVLKDTNDELCMAYMPLPMETRVMDVSILISAVVAKYTKYSNELKHHNAAFRLANYVVNRQTEYGAWYYTDPSNHSHIGHDNYHTGMILDALWSYMETTQNFSYLPQYTAGLEFYARHLFNSDGSPKWMSNKNYPYDIHGAAQGILTFSRHMDNFPELSNKISQWTFANLYDAKGCFYYQKGRYITKKYTLLRWCNAWMYRALAKLYKELVFPTTRS